MKVLLFACFLVFANAEDSPSVSKVYTNAGNSSLVEIARGYHHRIGIKEAERIRLLEEVRPKISNGAASYNGEHPYMAGLLVTLTTGETSLCGGTLVSSWRVVTAASCSYDGYSRGSQILVVLGSIYLYSGGTRVYATRVHSHPYFNAYTSANDVAVLVIPYVSTSSYIKPVTLPYGSYLTDSFAGVTAEAIGYGKTFEGSAITVSQSLRDVFVSVLSNAQCQEYYGSYVTGGVVCTSGSGGRGPCGGDMGGPLIRRFFDGTNHMLIGVAAFSSTSGCQSGHPTGYTRVTTYTSWIKNLL